ncbi:ABC transporter permease [Tissierella carlieri]
MINSKDKKGRVEFSTLSFDYIIDKLILFAVIISLLVFILYPIVMVISTSVYRNGVFSFNNYKNLLNTQNLKLIRNSLFVSTLSSILGTFFALCIAIYTFLQRGKLKKIIHRSLMITMISPPFVSALALIMLFGRRGIITHNLLGLSVNPYGWQGIVLLQTIGQISLASMMLISTLNSIDLRQILASRDLGATPMETLLHVILPSVFPGIMSVLFLQFTMNLADFGTPIIIGGKYKVLATEAYMTIFSAADLGKGAAISVLLIPPAVIAFYFYRKNMAKLDNLSDGTKAVGGDNYEFSLPIGFRFILGLVTGVFFILMILKYGNIFLSAISTNSSGKLVFTLAHFEKVRFMYLPSLYRSIVLSVTSGIISSIIGILLSYYTHRRNIPMMKNIEFISSLPYIIPGIFFGLGYIVAFNKEPLLLTGTFAIVILNCTFRHISVSNKAANAAFTTIDKKIEDAARDLGASRFRIFLSIILPLLKSTFLTSFINTFTACMTTVGAIIFLVSPRNVVASIEMFKDISNGQYGLGAVMASLLIIITVSVNLIAMRLLSKERV